MMLSKILVVLLISLSILIWNILNEATVLRYFDTKDNKYLKRWHVYDFWLKAFIVTYLSIYLLGNNIVAYKLTLSIGLGFNIIFNIAFNWYRDRQFLKGKSLYFKFERLFRLSPNSVLDSVIIRITNYLNKKIFLNPKFPKLKKYLLEYQKVNLTFILLELILIVSLWK